MNRLSKYLFVIALAVAATVSIINGKHEGRLIYWARMALILLSIFPICLSLNLEFAKLYFSFAISSDGDIQGAVSRNSSATADLGRLSYLITDKTGTITKP